MTPTDDPLTIPTEADTPPDHVEWLWPPYLPRGCLAVLDGDPGVGKTFVALDLAARVTAGLPMPDGCPSSYPPGNTVIVASGDDVVEDALLPRFLAASGVQARLSFFGGISRYRRTARPASFPHDFKALLDRIRVKQPVGLVVFDPFSVLFPGVAAHNDQAVRAHLAPFARLAGLTGTTFLIVRHVNKTREGKSLYRGCGSIGIAAAVRVGLFAGRHPDDPDRAVLSVTKANLGPPGRSLCYRIGEREGGVGVVWEGPTNLTSDELCSLRADDDGPSRRAEKWLQELLANGPVPATRAEAAAGEVGIAFRVLRAVKKKLGVESRKVTRDGKTWWEWAWPEGGLEPLGPL